MFPAVKIARRCVSTSSSSALAPMACQKESEEPFSALYCLCKLPQAPHYISMFSNARSKQLKIQSHFQLPVLTLNYFHSAVCFTLNFIDNRTIKCKDWNFTQYYLFDKRGFNLFSVSTSYNVGENHKMSIKDIKTPRHYFHVKKDFLIETQFFLSKFNLKNKKIHGFEQTAPQTDEWNPSSQACDVDGFDLSLRTQEQDLFTLTAS